MGVRGEVIEYPADTVLFKEGDPSDQLYLIKRGQVEITKIIEGSSRVVNVLGEGSLLGTMSLCGEQKRTATVRTLQATSCFCCKNSDILNRDQTGQLIHLVIKDLIQNFLEMERSFHEAMKIIEQA